MTSSHFAGRRRWLAWTLLFVLTLWQPACATTSRLPAADTAALDRLIALVVERLAVAPDVARTKWNTKAAIEDPVREDQIVSSVGAGAADAGVTRETAERFFRAQIEASKVVQRELFAQFEASQQPPFPVVADLNATVRPTLDRVTPQMLHALGRALPALATGRGRTTLRARSRRWPLQASVSRAALDVALEPLWSAQR